MWSRKSEFIGRHGNIGSFSGSRPTKPELSSAGGKGEMRDVVGGLENVLDVKVQPKDPELETSQRENTIR